MGASKLVWITRAEPGTAATASRLAEAGFAPLSAPLLTARSIKAVIDLEGVAALAFTSANGVRAFADQSPRRDIPVFAVGDATGRTASEAGFMQVTSAHGDSEALVRAILANPPRGRVLCPGPKHPAGDAPGALRRGGVAAEAVTLYETVPAQTIREPASSALRAGDVGAVLIHSARAGAALNRLSAGYDLTRVRVIALSKDCLAPLTDLASGPRFIAAAPDEASLLDALRAAYL